MLALLTGRVSFFGSPAGSYPRRMNTERRHVKIRRIKTLGIALSLSAIAAVVGLFLYHLPKNTLPSANRIADFVVINDSLFWFRDQSWLRKVGVKLPDLDQDNDGIRLVTMDESTLKPPNQGGFGQFPWDRRVYAKFLDRLAKAHAKVATFDLALLDPARNPEEDRVLAASMRRMPTVLGYTIGTTQGRNSRLSINGVAPVLGAVTAAQGSTTVDNPGGWLVGQYLTISETTDAGKRTDFQSLSGATVSFALGQKIEVLDAWNARMGNTDIPLDGEGYLLMLPFQTHEYVDQAETNGLNSRAGAVRETMGFAQNSPLNDVMKFDDDTMKAFAEDRIIVLGATAQAMGDFILTPNGRFPGVFSNLRFMDQLLSKRFIRRAPVAVDYGLIVIMPLFVGFLVTQLKPSIGIAIALLSAFVYTLVAVGVYAYTLHWVNLVHVDVAIVLSALFVALYRVVTEGADKRAIRDMFGKHVSPEIVSQMLEHDDPKSALNLQGKRVRVTIFYSDIRGFTAMSEKMTPEQIYGQLNEYFEEMCKIVFKYNGYVDKFIGDCLMAVFSAPNPQEDDAYKACMCAWEQQQKILEMAAAWAGEGRKIFTVGMGLNTGEVVMGNLGSSDRMNYTVIGDNVNTAARLYNVAKGGQTIISEYTYEEVKDRFIVNELQPVFVKGKELPLRNFEIVEPLMPGQPNTSKILDQSIVHEAAPAADH